MTATTVTTTSGDLYCQKLWAQAQDSLLDESMPKQTLPTFARQEIRHGKVLGVGGFGIVYEVERFDLDDDDEEEKLGNETSDAHPAERHLLQEQCLRQGAPRYCLKHLHKALTPTEQARGKVDFALEAHFLSRLSHPHISESTTQHASFFCFTHTPLTVQLRGTAQGSPLADDHWFIILDRLETTLDHRLKEWKEVHHQNSPAVWPSSRHHMQDLMLQRMTVVYELSTALAHLHQHALVYRDVKPENVGFDKDGSVQLFDFGLCTSVQSKPKVDGGYHLTGCVGSIPYMAPEVYQRQPYDNKCDVFSLAVLLWEVLSLQAPWGQLSSEQFEKRVVHGNQRLRVPHSWPTATKSLLPKAWNADPTSRPDMQIIASLLQNDLVIMTEDAVHRAERH